MKRSEAREKVFQVLFQMDFRDDFASAYKNILAENGLKGVQGQYAENAVTGVLLNLAEIDGTISANLKGWTIERLTKPAVAIMRLGVYEAFYDDDIAPLIAINEAVKLAYVYCDDKEAVFVNGLLNKLYQEKKNDSRDRHE